MTQDAQDPLPTEQVLPGAPDPKKFQDAVNATQQPEQSHAVDGIQGIEGEQSEQLQAVETETPKDNGKKPEVEVQPRIVARAEPQHERKEPTSPAPSLATSTESEIPNLGDGNDDCP